MRSLRNLNSYGLGLRRGESSAPGNLKVIKIEVFAELLLVLYENSLRLDIFRKNGQIIETRTLKSD